MIAPLTLPLQPFGVTLSPLTAMQAREDLALKQVHAVVKSADELWGLTGNTLVVDAYVKRCKRAGFTVCRNARGI